MNDLPERDRGLLFDDGRVTVLDKPAGVSMATSSREGHGGDAAVTRLYAALGRPLPEPLPLLVHRLDRGTSGVVLLARDEETHRILSLAFQRREVRKTYRALVFGHPVPARGAVDVRLGRDRSDGRKMAVREDGKPAVTRYETLRRFPALADLRLFPETGRTHQVRVHLASLGHPIAGDDLYGGSLRYRGVRDPEVRSALRSLVRPLLHAERVEVASLGIDVSAGLPADHATLLSVLALSKGAS
jgi:23S rRNA pseudouridine1911/1915/1917 synthase